MYRDLLGFEQERAEFTSWLEPPWPALTLMVDLDGAIRADRESLPDAWLGGLADTYTVVEFGPTYASIDLELTPLGAYQISAGQSHRWRERLSPSMSCSE